MKTICCLICSLVCFNAIAQDMPTALAAAVQRMETDTQFKHAAISMYVVNAKTGAVVFEKNAAIGLAPASCQKIITSAAAFELLGHDFKFNTTVGYSGAISNGTLNGNIYINGSGDPSLGSWRWNSTKSSLILQNICKAISAKGIKTINGEIIVADSGWESNTTPGGWVWDDIGNYYGAGSTALTWHENQYDLALKSGSAIGSAVTIKSTSPALVDVQLQSEVTAAKKGSGDNAYIYLAPQASSGYVRGTIPVNEDNFIISGSIPDPAKQFVYELKKALKENKIEINQAKQTSTDKQQQILFTNSSPSLDSLDYWFLKKSINLYGEALLKAIAFNKTGFASTENGIKAVKKFWTNNGIEPSAINIKDACGLSPANRVTTQSLVTVLQFAKKQPWFSSFYNALPEMNGIKMKDGYISDVRSYSGYIKEVSGNEYIFSFIVNNFDGSGATVKTKMWRLLDILKVNY